MSSVNNKLSIFTDFLNDEIPNSQPLSLPSSNDSQVVEDNAVSKITERNRPLKHSGQKGEFRCVEEIDVLNDETPNSQPLSLPSSNDSQAVEDNAVSKITERNRPLKHSGQKGEFRCVEEIDPKYRDVFTYPYFNLVQSRVIEDALYSDKSLVVCAPTGSGKTVLFEMAIVQLLTELEEKNYKDDYKIIYMAPVKALCSERLSEWYPKFTRLGLLCIEVTGDTDIDFPQLKPYRIIITTPEKWDMLTRRWKDHKALVEVIKLFLVDEVHILNDEVRGPVLEAVVSRMKTVESSAQSTHRIEQLRRRYEGCSSTHEEVPPPRIRFVAVSATVSNPEDVAMWLGTKDRPAVFYKFGDECRPVRLRRVVEGYPCPAGASIFKFDIILNYKIWPIIQRYHNGKPTLIFCNSRKSVLLTAETLSREVTVSFSPEQRVKLTEIASNIKTKKIQSLILSGVGCHHAGLLYEERQTIEQAFRNRELPILITTTTLAMGVNLPAHLVIVKNTQQYVNGTYQEYSISTILQMVGRAGRPQFDTEATAVIMTRLTDRARYEALVGGCEPLQSYLHKRLAENLNSEAALRTVCDVAQCVQWLNSTFLSVRAARDPKRYLALPPTAPAGHISKKIEELCVKAMNGLASAGLITMDEASCIESTEAGRLMSVHYLDLETMKLIMKINGSESLEELLWLVCESHELADMHLRVDERRTLNTLNRNRAAPTIRFPMKGKINSRQMKCSCVIQAVLGCLPIPDPSLNQEATKIIRIAERVCKCLVAYVTRPNVITQKARYFSAVLNSLILTKCVCAHLWENSPYVSKQLRGIGPTLCAMLASAGKVNFTLVEESHPRDLERIMNKPPPAGNMLRKQVSLLPKYTFKLTAIDDKTVRVKLLLINADQLAENMNHLTAGANHKSYIIVGDSENYLLHFSCFRDSNLLSVYDGCITFEITRLHNHEHKIMVHCISSNFVGVDEQSDHIFQSILLSDNNKMNTFNISGGTTEEQEAFVTKNNKRRNTSDVGQCIEKKKRENNLMESFKNLKKSFCKSTKDIKIELNKTQNLSHSVIQDLIEPGICDDMELRSVTFNSTPNPGDVNDLVTSYNIEDEESSILKDIESEMNSHVVDTVKVPMTKQDNIVYKINNKKKATNKVLWSENKNTLSKYNRKCTNIKNNYSFLDTLEKGSVEKELKETETDVSLSNTVKQHIEKFLGKSQDNSGKTQSILNKFKMDDNENKEFPSNESEQCRNITEINVINDVLGQSTLEDDPTELSPFNNTQHPELNKINDSLLVVKKPMLENSNNFVKSHNFEMCNKLYVDPLILNSKDFNEDAVKETFNANSSTEIDISFCKSNQKFISSNANNAKASNKTKLLDPNTDTKLIAPKKIKQSAPEYPEYPNDNDSILMLKAPTTIEKCNSIAKSNNFETLVNTTNKSLFDNINCNNQFLNKNTEKECYNSKAEKNISSKSDQKPKISNLDDANKINVPSLICGDNINISQSNPSTEDYEYVNNISYSTSKINIITRNDKNRQIQIINKLKIDLDVTEIVYKEQNNREDKTNEEHNTNVPTKATTWPHDIILSNSNNTAIKHVPSVEPKDCAKSLKMKTDKNIIFSEDTQNLEHNSTNDKNTIKNIIEKYKMKIRERCETQQYKRMKPVEINTFTPTIKSQRQYRIRDLHNTGDTLSKNMILSENFHANENKAKQEFSCTGSLKDNSIDSKYISPSHETHNSNDDDDLKYSPVNIDSENTSIHEAEDIKSILAESETDEINLSMFNPKILLQSIGEDSEVIRPPLEFCDDDPYSPIDSNDPVGSEINSMYTPLSSPRMEIENVVSSPTSKVETWTLSQDSDDYNLNNKYLPQDMFTKFQKESHSYCGDVKLSQFKFEGRPKFKK